MDTLFLDGARLKDTLIESKHNVESQIIQNMLREERRELGHEMRICGHERTCEERRGDTHICEERIRKYGEKASRGPEGENSGQ